MEKKLILVTSPPACGKTYVAKALAKNLKHIVYLDKDTLIVLSKQIFKVAGQPYDRSSAFFQQNIRDYEYDCVLALAMEALDYDDIVLINAPFTQEVRDNAFIADLKAKLAAKGATLAVIWVETSPEVDASYRCSVQPVSGVCQSTVAVHVLGVNIRRKAPAARLFRPRAIAVSSSGAAASPALRAADTPRSSEWKPPARFWPRFGQTAFGSGFRRPREYRP